MRFKAAGESLKGVEAHAAAVDIGEGRDKTLLARIELPGGVRHSLVKKSVDLIVRVADCISYEGPSKLGRLRRRGSNVETEEAGLGEAQLPDPSGVARCAGWSQHC